MQGLRAGPVEAVQVEQDLYVFEARTAGGCDGDEEVAGGVLAADAGLLRDEVRRNPLVADGGVEVAGGDDEFDDPSSSPASSPAYHRRKDGSLNVDSVAEQSNVVRGLRAQLAAEKAQREALAKEMTELLRAKAEAESTLRGELDTLRLIVERMASDNLRLRRPWALDL